MCLSMTASSERSNAALAKSGRTAALVLALTVAVVVPLIAEQEPSAEHHAGTVISIGKASFVLGEGKGLERKIYVSETTVLYRNHTRSVFSRMRVGNSADVMAEIRGHKIWAERVHFETRVPLSRANSDSGDPIAPAALTSILEFLTRRLDDSATSIPRSVLSGPQSANSGTLPPPGDCSHFVHDTYATIGLDYPYSSSRELYQGTQSFTQISTPRRGDLIVWRGHVGIVIDPGQRTFLSVLRRGLRVSCWRSAYWRRHGVPLFYQHDLLLQDGNLAATDRAPAATQQTEASGQE